MNIVPKLSLNIPTSEFLTTNIFIDDYDIKDMTEQAKKEYIEGKVDDWMRKQIVLSYEVRI